MPVFSAADGEQWTAQGFEKWRARVFVPALERAGLDRARPYDLRHSFASLLLHEGRSVIYVARQLGHGAELTLKTYGHVIDELEDAPRLPAEDAIRQARATMRLRERLVRVCARFSRLARRRPPEMALVRGARAGFEPAAYCERMRERYYGAV